MINTDRRQTSDWRVGCKALGLCCLARLLISSPPALVCLRLMQLIFNAGLQLRPILCPHRSHIAPRLISFYSSPRHLPLAGPSNAATSHHRFFGRRAHCPPARASVPAEVAHGTWHRGRSHGHSWGPLAAGGGGGRRRRSGGRAAAGVAAQPVRPEACAHAHHSHQAGLGSLDAAAAAVGTLRWRRSAGHRCRHCAAPRGERRPANAWSRGRARHADSLCSSKASEWHSHC